MPSLAEWAEVRSAMPVPAWLLKQGGRPEAYCHREMLDAVRYLVDNGVKWMALPVDFPYWRAVYDFFRRLSVGSAHNLDPDSVSGDQLSVLSTTHLRASTTNPRYYVRELHERLRRTARKRKGRNTEPSAAPDSPQGGPQ
ncbi:transposase [Streptomyces sp. NPDC002012]|uniref:transposase n=1 Tax=Streptomyces sp. NPDC002012 TaxID=3154532 RepID=UPI00331C70F1